MCIFGRSSQIREYEWTFLEELAGKQIAAKQVKASIHWPLQRNPEIATVFNYLHQFVADAAYIVVVHLQTVRKNRKRRKRGPFWKEKLLHDSDGNRRKGSYFFGKLRVILFFFEKKAKKVYNIDTVEKRPIEKPFLFFQSGFLLPCPWLNYFST